MATDGITIVEKEGPRKNLLKPKVCRRKKGKV